MALVRLADLFDQPAAAPFLRGVVAGGRYGNAYLFEGPAGIGKGTAALAFARALLCERAGGRWPEGVDAGPGLFGADPAAAAAPRLDDACGSCNACLKSGTMQHPDLKFAFPVTGEEKELEGTYAETLQAMREDPLHTFRYEKADSIRLSVTRELLREMAFQPFESPHRVVVMRDADRMRGDQYSALLKSIEEPGASTIWVLTTSRANKLPATIRSRCQRVRFSPLREDTIREFLAERAGVGGDAARLLAAQSGGSLSRAIEMRGGDPLALRDKALALLGPAAAGDPAGLWKAAQAFMNFGRTKRNDLHRAIEFHQLWLRDVLRAQAGAPDAMIVNDDRLADIRSEAARTTPAEIRRRLMVLEEAQKAIDGNVSPDLTLFSAMARIGNPGGARIGEGAWPPHAASRWDY